MVAAVALGLLWYAPEGRRLDASSRDYASHLLDTALKTWDLQGTKSEASEQFLAAVSDEKLGRLFSTFSNRLGAIQSHGDPRGESRLSVWNFHKVVTADYIVPVTFQKAQGTISLRFILNGDQWRLLALNVNSEALLQWGVTRGSGTCVV
jgi:hypothetical protein